MTRTLRELSQDERLALALLAANESSAIGQRARAILTWDTEADLKVAAEASELRPAQVRHWVQAFARLGLRALAPGTSTIGRASRPPKSDAAEPPSPRVRARLRGPHLRSTDPIVEAIRRILAHHFGKAKALERAAFEADEEAIHDMRVSIRRLRAALRIARPFFRPKRLEGVRTRLQEAAEVLGAVRDLDVILAHAQAYAGRQPEGEADLEGWLDTLRARRTAALEALREYLAGKRFRRLRSEVQAFLAGVTARGRADDATVRGGGAAEVAGASGSMRVRDVLPAALWAQYSTVRAHEAVAEPTPESLHALRIEIKRLRYLMEFFQGVLGARAIPAIELAVRAQDHLGRLNDAWVAAGMLRAYIGEAGSPDSSSLASAAAYLADLHREVEALTQEFPPLWQEITGPIYRRRLARLLARV